MTIKMYNEWIKNLISHGLQLMKFKFKLMKLKISQIQCRTEC